MKCVLDSMTTLNKYAAECCRNYNIHACTDVTGFGLLGHLHEMMDSRLSCRLYTENLPVIPEALNYADEFLLTAAAQRNRNHVGQYVFFDNIPFAWEEILFDPQTSGGLLIALSQQDAPELLTELKAAGLPAEIIGEICEREDYEIYVTK